MCGEKASLLRLKLRNGEGLKFLGENYIFPGMESDDYIVIKLPTEKVTESGSKTFNRLCKTLPTLHFHISLLSNTEITCIPRLNKSNKLEETLFHISLLNYNEGV